MILSPNTHLGSYQVLRLLGRGGMGEVYQARDLKLGREVALKVLRSDLPPSADRAARFEREARLLASLNHPHIATLYGVEEAEGVQFLVMEFVPGPTLADRLAGGPLELEEALALGRQITEALEAAHERGVMHRDLKPGNIKITPQGQVKLLDFGLAKAVAVEADSQAATGSYHPTVEGTILGTPAYMSPEQVRGQPLDQRTDVWSFACVLFEMLSGHRAFPGATGPDVFAAILEREPDWSVLPANIPASLRNLLERCLRKDPGRRVQDIRDARIEIVEAAEHPLSARPLPVEIPKPKLTSPPLEKTKTWSNAHLGPEFDQVQYGIFVNRLRHLHRLYRRWILAVATGLAIGFFVSLFAHDFVDLGLARSMRGEFLTGVVFGVPTAAFIAVAGSLWWKGAVRRHIKTIVQSHPGHIQQWGGEAMLWDRVSVEELLKAMDVAKKDRP
jgi:serine/threonine protein kinase